MGGEEGLRAAADGVPLRAVIADGAGASTSGDRALIAGGALAPVAASTDWLMMRLVARTRHRRAAALKDVVRRIRVPVLLIASSRTGERAIDDAFRRRIGSRAALWYVGDARHTQALERHPGPYARRIRAFLGAAVRPASEPARLRRCVGSSRHADARSATMARAPRRAENRRDARDPDRADLAPDALIAQNPTLSACVPWRAPRRDRDGAGGRLMAPTCSP